MVQVSKALFYGAVVVILALVLMNLRLQSGNAKLREGLRSCQSSMYGPSDGISLTELRGHDLTGPWTVNLQGTGRKAILFFDPHCQTCDKNWPSWEELLADKEIGHLLLPVSAAEDVMPDYLEKHHISRGRARLGLAPELVQDLKLYATPITILQRNGVVEKTWIGMLSPADVKDLAKALKVPPA